MKWLYLTECHTDKRCVRQTQCQGERAEYKQHQAGTICCLVLFIVMYLSLATYMKGAFRVTGHSEIGLLFFILPGAIANPFSHRREILRPLFGAMLVAPCPMLIMRLLSSPTRSSWQELT